MQAEFLGTMQAPSRMWGMGPWQQSAVIHAAKFMELAELEATSQKTASTAASRSKAARGRPRSKTTGSTDALPSGSKAARGRPRSQTTGSTDALHSKAAQRLAQRSNAARASVRVAERSPTGRFAKRTQPRPADWLDKEDVALHLQVEKEDEPLEKEDDLDVARDGEPMTKRLSQTLKVTAPSSCLPPYLTHCMEWASR